jgi:hypothetical protein
MYMLERFSCGKLSGKLTALTYSTYTVRHAVTLKWLTIVYVHLIQSQRIVTVTAKYGTATARLRICRNLAHLYEISA